MSKLTLNKTENHNGAYGGDCALFTNVQKSESRMEMLCSGDFYVIGKLWVDTVRTALIGSQVSLIPVVHAANQELPPKKPPPMKASDLPLYESPHYEYKAYLEDKDKCPKYKVKIAQEYLYPTVKSIRKEFVATYKESKKEFIQLKDDIAGFLDEKTKEWVQIMRDPNQVPMRMGVVALGTLSGFLLGGRLISKRLFFATLGGLATGALCFPNETDEVFRDVSFKVGKAALAVYNFTCRQAVTLRERVPCEDDMPPPPPPSKKNVCPGQQGQPDNKQPQPTTNKDKK